MIFRVSGLLLAVYSHNLVAVINCDYPSPTREPRLPGCRTSRLIESQVSINYQGVLPDCICSGLEHHALPSYPGHHQGQIGQGENKAKSTKINVKWTPSHLEEGRVARSALGRVVKLTNIILNTLGSPQPSRPYCPIHSLPNSSLHSGGPFALFSIFLLLMPASLLYRLYC